MEAWVHIYLISFSRLNGATVHVIIFAFFASYSHRLGCERHHQYSAGTIRGRVLVVWPWVCCVEPSKYNENILVEKMHYFICSLSFYSEDKGNDPHDVTFHMLVCLLRFTTFTTSWLWAAALVECQRVLSSKLESCYDHLLRIN